jgi:hypothetical protein
VQKKKKVFQRITTLWRCIEKENMKRKKTYLVEQADGSHAAVYGLLSRIVHGRGEYMRGLATLKTGDHQKKQNI